MTLTNTTRRVLPIASALLTISLALGATPVRVSAQATQPATPGGPATASALLPECVNVAPATPNAKPTDIATDAATQAQGTASVTPTNTLAPTPTANPTAGYLGISATQVAKCGARIEEIKGGSAADKAGLQAGDVIVAVNGKPITGVADLRDAIRTSKAGDTLTLTYQRGKTQKDVTVTLDAIPASTTATQAATAAPTAKK